VGWQAATPMLTVTVPTSGTGTLAIIIPIALRGLSSSDVRPTGGAAKRILSPPTRAAGIVIAGCSHQSIGDVTDDQVTARVTVLIVDILHVIYVKQKQPARYTVTPPSFNLGIECHAENDAGWPALSADQDPHPRANAPLSAPTPPIAWCVQPQREFRGQLKIIESTKSKDSKPAFNC